VPAAGAQRNVIRWLTAHWRLLANANLARLAFLGGVARLLGLEVRLDDHREGVGRGIQLRPVGAVVEQLDAGEADADLTARRYAWRDLISATASQQGVEPFAIEKTQKFQRWPAGVLGAGLPLPHRRCAGVQY
jgi:hypothetical protein